MVLLILFHSEIYCDCHGEGIVFELLNMKIILMRAKHTETPKEEFEDTKKGIDNTSIEEQTTQ